MTYILLYPKKMYIFTSLLNIFSLILFIGKSYLLLIKNHWRVLLSHIQ
jgi:hypothetical protein